MFNNAVPFVYGFVILSVCCFVTFCAENSPDEERNAVTFSVPSSTAKTRIHEEHLGFVQAFLKTISVIFVSEIGDKTFFIAAIMAMKHPRAMVFIGAILALAFMTIISVLGGWAMSIIPKKYTYYGSVILFLLFGLKMILDGIKMSPHEGQEEYEEVQAELRKREEEFEKETLTKDIESGYVNKNSKIKIFHVLSHIIVQAFTLTFVAEWGDRSQLATFLLASKDDKFGITFGAIAGHSICTGIAVTGGRFVAQKISVKTVTIFGGIVFIVCALYTLLREESDDTRLI